MVKVGTNYIHAHHKKDNNMHPITLLLTLLFTVSSYAQDIYQWTDESGQFHYSQFPPEQRAAAKMQVNVPTSKNTSAASEKLKKLRQSLEEQAVDRVTASEEDKVAKENKKRMAENCQLAQQKLREFQNNGRIFRTLENGEREWYDQKGRENLIANAKKDVDKYCN